MGVRFGGNPPVGEELCRASCIGEAERATNRQREAASRQSERAVGVFSSVNFRAAASPCVKIMDEGVFVVWPHEMVLLVAWWRVLYRNGLLRIPSCPEGWLRALLLLMVAQIAGDVQRPEGLANRMRRRAYVFQTVQGVFVKSSVGEKWICETVTRTRRQLSAARGQMPRGRPQCEHSSPSTEQNTRWRRLTRSRQRGLSRRSQVHDSRLCLQHKKLDYVCRALFSRLRDVRDERIVVGFTDVSMGDRICDFRGRVGISCRPVARLWRHIRGCLEFAQGGKEFQ